MKVCPNFIGKEYKEWSGEILSCSLRAFELPVRAIKFLEWQIYDLSAIKSAQPNPWLENYRFPSNGIKAKAHNCRICNVKVPFDLSLISLKSDWCKSSIFIKRSTNLSTLVQSDLIWSCFQERKAFGNILFFILTVKYEPFCFFVIWHVIRVFSDHWIVIQLLKFNRLENKVAKSVYDIVVQLKW